MLTSANLQILAQQRLAEAQSLLLNEHWSGAYYLAGYAAEFALKAIIADQFVAHAIPDRRRVESTYTHSLPRLIDLAGLKPALDIQARDKRFLEHWEILKEWNENSQYQVWLQSEAKAMIEALADEDNGILKWIRLHW
jgi:hypothetical protein